MPRFSMFEKNYAALVADVLGDGETRQSRNSITRSSFAKTLVVEPDNLGELPIIQGRKYFFKGVLGELAAFFRGPTCVEDFTKWDCNYWGAWANANGDLTLDYGNAWLQDGQIDRLKWALKNDPTDRRMLITGWQPKNLSRLSLPCCHYAYQFYVREGKYLDMLWNQRSADLMLGVPADALLGYLWIVLLANEFGYTPGKLTMMLGDTHVYASHVENAYEYLDRVTSAESLVDKIVDRPQYKLLMAPGQDFLTFEPSLIDIAPFTTLDPITFELLS